MRIWFLSSEVAPYAKTGGLGDVAASLPRALTSLGHDVYTVTPLHAATAEMDLDLAPGPKFSTLFGTEELQWEAATADGVWFLRAGDLFDGPVYGEGTEEALRYAAFTQAALTLASELSIVPDIVHANDWPTGLAPLYLGPNGPPTVFTIHNAAYSILGPLPEVGALLDLQPLELGLGGPIEWYGQANFLKAGIARAFRVTTVSPTFARQLLEDPTISGGLQGVLRSRADGVAGILNGIDTRSWDPRTDPSLPAPFSPGRLRGRAMARSALLEQAGLDPGSVLFGNVGRMAEQKGIGLLDPSLPELVEEGLRLVLVGNGELDHVVDGWAERFPEAVWHAPYDEGLARLVSAGTDAYLMPSRFEPCGLGQMYAMRYGSVPVVRLTGGLADSVIDLDEHPADGTGFGFRSFLPESLAKTVRRAMRVFRKSRSDWRRLQRNGMHRDFSWDRAAAQYLDVYDSVLG